MMVGKKILILGGNGFIGRNLCRRFAGKYEEVISMDISMPDQPLQGITYLQADFFNDDELKAAVMGKDIVYHAVSTINPGNSNNRYLQGYENDLVQTVKLCSFLTETGGRMIFLSSGGTVYGNQNVQPICESFRPVPINHYGSVKLCIENVIRTFNIQFHTKFLIARISNPYGPGQDYHKGVGFIDAALKHALNNEPIEIWGNGEIVRDYIHIEDVCEMLESLTFYRGHETTFNISSNEGISQNQVIQILKELGVDASVVYKPGRSVDCQKIVLDNNKYMKFEKKQLRPFKEGVRSYLDYLKRNK